MRIQYPRIAVLAGEQGPRIKRTLEKIIEEKRYGFPIGVDTVVDHNEITDHQVVFITSKIITPENRDIIKVISGNKRTIIYMNSLPEENPKKNHPVIRRLKSTEIYDLAEQMRDPQIEYVLPMILPYKEIDKTIDLLKRERKLKLNASIGFIGGGNLGQMILSNFLEYKVGKVLWFSRTFADGEKIDLFGKKVSKRYHDIVWSSGMWVHSDRLTCCDNLDQLMDSPILVFATSVRRTEWPDNLKRETWRKMFYQDSVKKFDETLNAALRTTNHPLIVVASNPVDVLCSRASQKGYEAEALIGVSADHTRMKHILRLENSPIRNYTLMGTHDKPIMSPCLAKEKDGTYIITEDESTQRLLNEIGPRTVKALERARHIGDRTRYEDSPKAIADILYNLFIFGEIDGIYHQHVLNRKIPFYSYGEPPRLIYGINKIRTAEPDLSEKLIDAQNLGQEILRKDAEEQTALAMSIS